LGDSCVTVRARQKAPRRRTWTVWSDPLSTRPPSAVTVPLDPDAQPAVRLGRSLAGLARGDGPGWRAGRGPGEPGRRRAPVGGGAWGGWRRGGEEARRPSNGDADARRGEPTLNAGLEAGPHTLTEGVARQRSARDSDQLVGLRQLPPACVGGYGASSQVCAGQARGCLIKPGGWAG
jgi:hypothetical protein